MVTISSVVETTATLSDEAAMSKAVELELIKSNPLCKVVLPKKTKVEKDFFNQDEIREITAMRWKMLTGRSTRFLSTGALSMGRPERFQRP